MSDPLRNAAPVGGVGGFPNRSPHDLPQRHAQPEPPEQHEDQPASDGVDLHGAAQVARRLLRERVLASTRQHLELADDEHVPTFAEIVDNESVAAFVGRLIGAQNMLASLRANRWPAAEVRGRLDRAMREGTSEVLELLVDDPKHGAAAAAVVAGVLTEYGERLVRLADAAPRS